MKAISSYLIPGRIFQKLLKTEPTSLRRVGLAVFEKKDLFFKRLLDKGGLETFIVYGD